MNEHYLEDINEWAKEVKAAHIEKAAQGAFNMGHPYHTGMTKEDIKEIEAYDAGIRNFLYLLKQELI